MTTSTIRLYGPVRSKTAPNRKGTVQQIRGTKADVAWRSGVSTWVPLSSLVADEQSNVRVAS